MIIKLQREQSTERDFYVDYLPVLYFLDIIPENLSEEIELDDWQEDYYHIEIFRDGKNVRILFSGKGLDMRYEKIRDVKEDE